MQVYWRKSQYWIKTFSDQIENVLKEAGVLNEMKDDLYETIYEVIEAREVYQDSAVTNR